MPGLDYTPHYRLRVPQSGDPRTLADFQRVFRDNFLVVDTQLKAHDNRIDALESGGVTDGSGDATAGSGGAESSNDSGLAQLRTRLSALEAKAVTGFRKDDNGLWYAYNKNGQDVCGPFDFGANGGVTLAELFDAGSDDTVTYRNPTPITGAETVPNITLSGIFNAVSDDSVTYQAPTPIVFANA